MSIKFSKGVLDDSGSLKITEVRTLEQSSIQKCPHYIMVAEHYRADESCRCDDESHVVMSEWGYVWSGDSWGDGEEEAGA